MELSIWVRISTWVSSLFETLSLFLTIYFRGEVTIKEGDYTEEELKELTRLIYRSASAMNKEVSIIRG